MIEDGAYFKGSIEIDRLATMREPWRRYWCSRQFSWARPRSIPDFDK